MYCFKSLFVKERKYWFIKKVNVDFIMEQLKRKEKQSLKLFVRHLVKF